MSENNRPDDKVNEEVFEEQRREAIWRQYFPKMRFWICCNLIEILFLFAAPLVINLFDNMRYPGWDFTPYHYEFPQLFLFFILAAISLTGAFYLFTAKDKSRLATVKWLSLAGAVIMYLSFLYFRKGIGHLSLNEEKLWWIMWVCTFLHILSCIRIFRTYKKLI